MSVKLGAKGASRAVEVILPRVATNLATGKRNRWLAAEGERVREGQPIVEIEADQGATEVQAPVSGVFVVCAPRLATAAGRRDDRLDRRRGRALSHPDLQALAGELRAQNAAAATS